MLGKNLPLADLLKNEELNNQYVLGGANLKTSIAGVINLDLPGTWGGLHSDTIILAWVAMAFILVTCWALTRNLVVEGPGSKLQALLEGTYNFIVEVGDSTIGHRCKEFLPLLCAIFLFVLVSNLIGIMPWLAFEHASWWPTIEGGKEHFELAACTTDFNVTAALATISIVVYLASGVLTHGSHYVKLFFFSSMAPIEWLDLLIRPTTLALRLLLVITADEILRAVFLGICPVLLPIPVMAFEIFIAGIQALVFTLLTGIYIGMAVEEHH